MMKKKIAAVTFALALTVAGAAHASGVRMDPNGGGWFSQIAAWFTGAFSAGESSDGGVFIDPLG